MALSNSQHNEIMRNYDRMRAKHEHELDLRIEEIEKKLPGIQKFNEDIADAFKKQADKRIHGQSLSEEEKEEIPKLIRKKKELLKKNGYPENYLELQYNCPFCKDTGYIGNKKCSCYLQASAKILFHQSGLSDTLTRQNFDTFSDQYYSKTKLCPNGKTTIHDYMMQIFHFCKNFADHYEEKHGSLLFYGATGTGKTFFSNCIAKELLDNNMSVVYIPASEFFQIFRDNRFRSGDDCCEEDTLYLSADLLIIDDLGTELPDAYTLSVLYRLLDKRHRLSKGTILSTNLSFHDLRDIYQERICSRILSYYDALAFYGDDIRILKKYHT